MEIITREIKDLRFEGVIVKTGATSTTTATHYEGFNANSRRSVSI